jgi:hypothetical protein
LPMKLTKYLEHRCTFAIEERGEIPVLFTLTFIKLFLNEQTYTKC